MFNLRSVKSEQGLFQVKSKAQLCTSVCIILEVFVLVLQLIMLVGSLRYIETEHYCTPKYAIPKGKFCDSNKWKPVLSDTPKLRI